MQWRGQWKNKIWMLCLATLLSLAGAGAVIGTEAVAKSPADGYTLPMMSNTHTVNESLLKTRPYDLMRDFAPVAPVNYSDLLMVVHPSVAGISVD